MRRRGSDAAFDRECAFYLVVILVGVFLIVSHVRYRLLHPEKTGTQLFLELPQQLTWE